MSEEEEELGNARLIRGDVVEGHNSPYVVLNLLGEGGFGAVYRVASKATKEESAMKVEYKSKRDSKLKMEVAILRLMEEADSKSSRHFTRLIDRGRNDQFTFVVMTLVGPSLDDMKRERPSKVFSPGTAFGAGVQCLEAIQALHEHGFIHRDIKPANFARGLKHHIRNVVLLDFGIARRFRKDGESGEIKTPRQRVGFKGTVRFAAINCHKKKEMGPKDDCETWLYLLCDIFVPHGLPWKKFTELDDVMNIKVKAAQEDRTAKMLFPDVRGVDILCSITKYIHKLGYADHVDYGYIYKMCGLACKANGGDMEARYDWEK